MNHKPRLGGLIYGAVSAIICTGITIGGVRWAVSEAQEPEIPVPAITAPVLAVPETKGPEITAADLWSDDRSRIDTPLLDVPLEAEMSAPVIKCKKTPRKKCNYVAERREKR